MSVINNYKMCVYNFGFGISFGETAGSSPRGFGHPFGFCLGASGLVVTWSGTLVSSSSAPGCAGQGLSFGFLRFVFLETGAAGTVAAGDAICVWRGFLPPAGFASTALPSTRFGLVWDCLDFLATDTFDFVTALTRIFAASFSFSFPSRVLSECNRRSVSLATISLNPPPTFAPGLRDSGTNHREAPVPERVSDDP